MKVKFVIFLQFIATSLFLTYISFFLQSTLKFKFQ